MLSASKNNNKCNALKNKCHIVIMHLIVICKRYSTKKTLLLGARLPFLFYNQLNTILKKLVARTGPN